MSSEYPRISTSSLKSNDKDADMTTRNTIKPHRPNSRPPPIHIKNINLKTIINLFIVKNVNKDTFYVKQAYDPTNITVFSTEVQTSENIKKLLIDNKYEYFTYTPKNLRPKTVILKGIRGDFSEEDIMNELKERKLKNVSIIKLSKIVFNKHQPNNYHFLVKVSSDSQLKQLTNIACVAQQKANWDKLKRNTIFQCKKCQRFRRASTNCEMAYRCVKCSGSHEPGQCKIPALSDRSAL